MSDQRSAFRFRIPRLRSSIPPPRTTTQTTPPPPLQPIRPLEPEPPVEPATTPEPPVEPETTPEPPVEPETTPEPPVEPATTPEPQNEPASMAASPWKKNPSLPSSPIVTPTKMEPNEVLPVPETENSNSSIKSSEETESTPEVKKSTTMNQAMDSVSNEETSMELSSEQTNPESHIKESKENTMENTISSIPNSPQTKSMISDKIPAPEFPQNPKPGSVITFAGDNRGTSMHIGFGANKRERKIHIHRRYKVNPDEISETTTDEEENSWGKKLEHDLDAIDDQERNAYVNCNIQGINNSMVINCSISERNPGVHLGSSFNPKNVKTPKRKNTNSMETKKVKVSITPSQKLTYEPTIRRRCLRGLFMESSDSDPDDRRKPRRHGCRYICGEKSNKDDKMDDR